MMSQCIFYQINTVKNDITFFIKLIVKNDVTMRIFYQINTVQNDVTMRFLAN